jgi:hypothetical protein
VRKGTGSTDLDSPVIPDLIDRIPRAVFHMIQRTITEKTIDLFNTLMTWIILAISILKIFI